MSRARRTAEAAESSTTFRAVARAGYVATGVVHALIGGLAVALAFGGGGDTDQSGAFEAIAEAPAGVVVLWALAVALTALSLWCVIAGALAADDDTMGRWRERITEWGRAVVFLAIGFLAARMALGERPDSDSDAQDATQSVLAIPGGPFLLGAVGFGVAVGGVVFAVMGIRRSFRKRMTIPAGHRGTAIVALGVAGYVAKGVALAIVGLLLLIAAIQVDPEQAGGLNNAFDSLLELPFGPVLVSAVGIGFIAYGVFCGFRAKYARL